MQISAGTDNFNACPSLQLAHNWWRVGCDSQTTEVSQSPRQLEDRCTALQENRIAIQQQRFCCGGDRLLLAPVGPLQCLVRWLEAGAGGSRYRPTMPTHQNS